MTVTSTDEAPPAPATTNRWTAVGSALLWYALPGLALATVAAYVGIAIVWHVNPPVVPVTGQSMQPSLHAGDLVVLRGVQARELRRGDVIAFRTTKEAQSKYDVPATYVHRIVEVSKGATGREFRTKGDNVAGRDPFFVFESQVVGEMAFSIPAAGYPVLFFRSRQGMIFAAMLALVLVAYFLMGMYDRRQEVAAQELVTLGQVAVETRELKQLLLAGPQAARAPPSQAEPPVPTPGAEATRPRMCSRGCHELPPTARFDPHTGDVLPPVREHASADPADPAEAGEPDLTSLPAATRALHLAEFQLAPVYREEPELQPEPVFSTALVPYVPPRTTPAIDFTKLEAEIHAAVASGAAVQQTMHELVGAVGEYGEHLRSHTAVMQNLAASTSELHAAAAEMRQLLAALTQVVTTLAERDVPPQA